MLRHRLKQIFWPDPAEAVRLAMMTPDELLRERNRRQTAWMRFAAQKYGLSLTSGHPRMRSVEEQAKLFFDYAHGRVRNDFLDPNWQPPEFNWGYSRFLTRRTDQILYGASYHERTPSGLLRRVDPQAVHKAALPLVDWGVTCPSHASTLSMSASWLRSR